MKRSVVGLSVVGLIFSLTPATALQAADRTNFTSPFCRNIDSLGDKAIDRIDDRIAKIEERFAAGDKRFDEKLAAIDARRAGKRADWDKKRDAAYVKLAERADTETEKVAVGDFEKTMDAAVTTRRNAVDKAVAEFRTGLESSIDKRHDGAEAAAIRFKNSISTAVSTAKNACTSDGSDQGIGSAFRASVKSARATLRSDIQSLEKVNTERQELAKTRNAAVQSAIDSFKATAGQARAELKAAFAQ